jgi:DNA-binding response OmpR family regulator
MKLKNKRVLVVDDDPEFQVIIGKILESQGINVRRAFNLQEAYKGLATFAPDLIILDLNLDREKGVAVLLEKKKNPALANVPVVVCSTENMRDTVEKVLTIGCQDYILKPVKQTVVIQKLRRILSNEPKLEFVFPTPPLVKVECDVECVGLSEAYCSVRSNMKLNEHTKLEVVIDNLVGLGINVPDHRVNFQSKPLGSGMYETTFTMLGITETDISKIRKLKIGWRV